MAKVVGGTWHKVTMISTVIPQGKTCWMIMGGSVDHEKLIAFFVALIEDADQTVFLILDNPGVHHCKSFRAWFERTANESQSFDLPSYRSELKPDEGLNSGVKGAIGARVNG